MGVLLPRQRYLCGDVVDGVHLRDVRHDAAVVDDVPFGLAQVWQRVLQTHNGCVRFDQLVY